MKRYRESLTVTFLTKEDDDGLISAREALMIAILDGDDTSSAINNLLFKVPLRKKFHALDFCEILEHNSGSLDSLNKLAVALKILEKYGRNLLQPVESRPKTWRLIKHSNKTFTDKVMIIEDGLYILQLIGYSESRQEGMSIPDGVDPDFIETLNIVTDIFLARREIEAYMSNCHPNPASIEAFLVYQQKEVIEPTVQSSIRTGIKKQETTQQIPGNTTSNSSISSNERSSIRDEPFKREKLNRTVETNDLQCSSDEIYTRRNDGEEVRETVKDNDLKCSSDEILEEHQTVLQNDSKRHSIEQRFGQLPIFTTPEQLIYTDDNGKLAIRDTTMEQINCIDVPMVIVGICGSYRTGKSYLMNILANAKKGFKIGHSVKGETKGIWAWLRPHPKQSDQVLLLLDTEGFSDIEKADTENDDQLFCLSALLSSMLIYNQKGAIEKENLEKMSFITKMTKSIRLAAVGDVTDEDSENLLLILTPTFIMCIRDFSLILECSEDEYFTGALKIEPGKEAYSHTKECIKKYFPKRKCFTLPAPAPSRHLSKLEDADEKYLDEEFNFGLERLKAFVYNCSPKVFDAVTDRQADGLVFEAFARTYVQALAKGDVMTFTQASEKASELHNGKLVMGLVNEYQQEVDAILLPVPKKLDLEEKCLELQSTKLHVFRKQSYPQKRELYVDQAMMKMECIRQKKMEENTAKVQASLSKILEKIHEHKIQRRKAKYSHHLGVSRYKQDVETVQSMFLLETETFDKDEQITALRNYERNIKDEEMRLEVLVKRHEEEEAKQKLKKRIEEMRKKYEYLIEREKQLALEAEKERMKQNFEQIMEKQKSESLWQQILRWFGLSGT